MSDKNRNMNDINNQKTAEQQAFSEEIRRRLAEPGSGKPTLDEFKVMVYKDREKRRKKRNALVACIVAAFIVGYFTYDDLVPEVGADKNLKETIQTEDGVIIEDGGYGSSVGECWIVDDEKELKDAKKVYPQLLIPQYVPNNYLFEQLVIKNIADNDIICEYYYRHAKKEKIEIEILITDGGEGSLSIYDYTSEVMCTKGTIYLQEKENKATIHIDDGIVVSIWCNPINKYIIKIVEGLE
ncbi:MAG: hypothetical protein IJA01_06735 [Firmicutes bacterium]|nr:hypothetical protein [Bacillota bacterium]